MYVLTLHDKLDHLLLDGDEVFGAHESGAGIVACVGGFHVVDRQDVALDLILAVVTFVTDDEVVKG